MIITKLTAEHLRYFIFLMDGIISREEDFIEVGRIFKELQQQEIDISWHSINRAFELRNALKMELPPNKKAVLPQKRTLDALTKYYYGKRFVFRDLVCTEPDILVSEEEVRQHYERQRPTDAVIHQLFKKQPEKIAFIADQKESYEECLLDVENRFNEVVDELKETKERFKEFQLKVEEDINVQNMMITHLKAKIEQLETKRKRAFWVYRFFGAIGLFFVRIDYKQINLDTVIEDYLDGLDDILEGDILEDII
ncbi:hypothetical protein ACFQZJ_06180 [Maribacter chungangensis]|uniref:Uncharacterized protein n=1 Tax=Maribacter chungangensis TaxID=1069117 RepID=A0ABW3B366_9FLAO